MERREGGGVVTAITNAVSAVPHVNKSLPKDLENCPEYFGEIPLKNLKILEISNFMFPGKFFKSPDSWQNHRNFIFLPKQPFLELTPPGGNGKGQDVIGSGILLRQTCFSYLTKFSTLISW